MNWQRFVIFILILFHIFGSDGIERSATGNFVTSNSRLF